MGEVITVRGSRSELLEVLSKAVLILEAGSEDPATIVLSFTDASIMVCADDEVNRI